MNIESIIPELKTAVNPAFRNNLGHILKPVAERTRIIQDYVNQVGYLEYVSQMNMTRQSPEIAELKNKHKIYFLFQNTNVSSAVIKNESAKTLVVETAENLSKNQQAELSRRLTEAYSLTRNTTKIKEILRSFNATILEEMETEPSSVTGSINTGGAMSVLPNTMMSNANSGTLK